MRANLTIVGACVCLASIMLTEALPTEHRIQIRRTRLCGRRLVEALAFLCGNEYYEPQPLNKRGGKTESSWWPEMGGGSKRSGFVDGKNALSLFRNGMFFLRKGRGVSDECCKKSCSFGELTSYCKHSISFESSMK